MEDKLGLEGMTSFMLYLAVANDSKTKYPKTCKTATVTATVTSTSIEVVPTTVYKHKAEVCRSSCSGPRRTNEWRMLTLMNYQYVTVTDTETEYVTKYVPPKTITVYV